MKSLAIKLLLVSIAALKELDNLHPTADYYSIRRVEEIRSYLTELAAHCVAYINVIQYLLKGVSCVRKYINTFVWILEQVWFENLLSTRNINDNESLIKCYLHLYSVSYNNAVTTYNKLYRQEIWLRSKNDLFYLFQVPLCAGVVSLGLWCAFIYYNVTNYRSLYFIKFSFLSFLSETDTRGRIWHKRSPSFESTRPHI